MKTFRPHVLAAAIAAVGLTVAACSSSGTTAATQTETVTVTAEADAPDEAAAPADRDAPDAADTDAREDADEAVSPGARCALSAGTEAIVVQGALDCATVDAAWEQAIADPGFADRSSRVTAGDFRCRAHQTQPIQTGFCETDDAPYSGFKVIRGAGGHHSGPHGGMHHGGR